MNHWIADHRLLACVFVLVALTGCTGGSTPNPTRPATKEIAQKTAELEEPLPDVSIVGEVLDDYWEIAYVHGAKIGFGHTVAQRVKGSIVRESHQRFTVTREGQTSVTTISLRSVESEEGRLSALETQIAFGDSMQATRGRVQDGVLQLQLVTAGKESLEEIELPDNTFGLFGPFVSLEQKRMQPGEKRKIRWFQSSPNNIVTEESLEAMEREPLKLLDDAKTLLKIHSLNSQGIETWMWADDEGRVWKTWQPLQDTEVYRVTEERAREKSQDTWDLMESALVKVDPPSSDLHDASKAIYIATLKQGDPLKLFATGLSQKVELVGEHRAKITVERVTASEPAELATKQTLPVAADSAANNIIQSDDPLVMKMAKSTADSEMNAWKVATSLEKLVHEKMENKNFSQAFATAADVAKTLEGDCTEHAVLLAALCRARNIPARVAAGLVYYPKGNGFAYHMWTEAWTGDRWVPLDATLGRGGIGAGHIKLFDSHLQGASAFSSFLTVMNVLGQLELKIEMVEPARGSR